MKMMGLILGYLQWHYGKAIKSLGAIWKNFFTFIFHFFSINLLLKNFFDPWKRMNDSYPHKFDPKLYVYAFITNTITRIVGMIMRSVLLITGLISLGILIILYPIALILWLITPLIILALLWSGLQLILK